MQKAKPSNATGVPVSIDAVDPNGNYVHLGDVTSDANGQYSLLVDSSILDAGAGTYKIVASFAGSKSYYSSTAETALSLTESAPTASPLPVAAQPPTEMYFAISTIAIIVAIAIATVVIVRKRP